MRLCSAIIISARLESTRLPRKLLLADSGKPLIQHTFEAAGRAPARGVDNRGDRQRGDCGICASV